MTQPGGDSVDLTGRRVLLGITGGIAAYKAALLARELVQSGASVDVVMTRGAEHFIGAPTFEGITGRRVRREVWEEIDQGTHVQVGRDADAIVVYPATAHTLSKFARGAADDLLSGSVLVARCPIIVAPAMHTEMWHHPATQANVDTLKAQGVIIIGPDDGPLMGGDVGAGRVVAPRVAFDRVVDAIADRRTLVGRTVVVTAGGTREDIDPVRFLGNRSTGKMGFALAEAAQRRGADVHLVCAPNTLDVPVGVTAHQVRSALQMHAAVMSLAATADVIIKAAAVADFRPATIADTKIKKAAGTPKIELVPNPDILAELGALDRRPLLVGFAAETTDVIENGRNKLRRKSADLLVVNDVSEDGAGFGTDTNKVIIMSADGPDEVVPLASKSRIARNILDAVERTLAARA